MVNVYVDERERKLANQIIEHYEEFKEKYNNIESMTIETLDTGDTCTDDYVLGYERKSSFDYVPSILSGKLKQQLLELRTKYRYPMLVVEGYDGIFDCMRDNPQVHPNVILGAVTSSFAHNSVPMIFINGFYIKFILESINKFYDGKRKQYQSVGYTSIRRNVDCVDFSKYFVMGLPNVGWTTGEAILKKYDNSVRRIVSAPIEELMEFKGITEERAKQIKECFK